MAKEDQDNVDVEEEAYEEENRVEVEEAKEAVITDLSRAGGEPKPLAPCAAA
jgi:hypothetical protein